MTAVSLTLWNIPRNSSEGDAHLTMELQNQRKLCRKVNEGHSACVILTEEAETYLPNAARVSLYKSAESSEGAILFFIILDLE